MKFLLAFALCCCAMAMQVEQHDDVHPAVALKQKIKQFLERSEGVAHHAQRHLSSCTTLSCASSKLYTELDRFMVLRETVSERIDPLNEFCDSVTDLEDRVVRAHSLRETLQTAFGVAKAIPQVGSLFSAPYSVLKSFKTPLNKLKTNVKATTSSVIDPWDTSIGTFMEKLSSMETQLNSSIDFVGSFEEIFDTECIPDTMDMFVPGFSTQIGNVKSAAIGFADRLTQVNNAMSWLSNKLSSWFFANMVYRFDKFVKALNNVLAPFDALEIIDELMDKTITIPWVGTFKNKDDDGLPRYCPTGYKKSGTGLACIEECTDGYHDSTDFNCLSTCPSGYSDVGLACKNKYYNVRSIKTVNWLGKCSGSYSRKGLLCWRDCSSGYKSHSFALFGVCYKSCPNDMDSDPTKVFCMKKFKGRGAGKTLQCRSGYNFYGVACMEKCDSGQVDAGLVCYVPKNKSFTIRDLANELKKIISKIEDLPIVKEINDAIEKLVTSALKFILDRLNLPSPDDLIDLPTVEVGDLPTENLVTKLNELDIPDMDSMIDLEMFEGMFNNMFSKFGISNPIDFAKCDGDFRCVTDMVGIDPFPFPAGFNVESLADGFEFEGLGDDLQLFEDAIKGCKTYSEKVIDLPKTLNNVMGLGGDEQCSTIANVCTELDIDDGAMDTLLERITATTKPLSTMVTELFKQGEADDTRRRLGSNTFGSDNWELSIPTIPLTWLFPKFKFFKNELDWSYSWFSFKREAAKKSLSSFVKWEMERTNLYITIGKKYGKDYSRVDLRVGTMLSYMHVKNDPKKTVYQVIDHFQKRATSLDGEFCALQWNEKAFNQFDCLSHQRVMTPECRELCKLRKKSYTLKGWKSKFQPYHYTGSSDRSDAFWKSDQGMKVATTIIDAARLHTRQMEHLISTQFKKTDRMVKNAKKALMEMLTNPKLCIYQKPKVGDFTMDFGVRGLAHWNTDFSKLGGMVTAEVKFNVADFEEGGEITPSEAFKCLYFGFSKAFANTHKAANYKPRFEVGFNVGFEILLGETDVDSDSPTESPTVSPTATDPPTGVEFAP